MSRPCCADKRACQTSSSSVLVHSHRDRLQEPQGAFPSQGSQFKTAPGGCCCFFFFFSPGCFLHPVLQEPAWSHSNQYQWSFLYDHSPEHMFFSFLCLYPEELIWSPWDLQRLTLGPWGSGTFPSASTDKPASPYLGHPPPSFCAPHPSSSASLGLLDFTV